MSLDYGYLLCIRNVGLLELIKIAITYMNYNEIAYAGKIYSPQIPHVPAFLLLQCSAFCNFLTMMTN